MKPQILLVLGILAVLLVSGCSQFSLGTTNLQEVLSDKSKFEGKEITIQGVLLTTYNMQTNVDKQATGGSYIIQDSQGYSFNIKPYPEARQLFISKTYSVTGYVKSVEYCDCQSQSEYLDGTKLEWVPAYKFGIEGKALVEACEKPPETITAIAPGGKVTVYYRCKSDSKNNFYYLEASKPMTLLN